ncbi:hypothetical protein CH274_16675 [Rhodococcus sp. 06-418-5]|nr:hypothetical protein CH274_16675 [Rhodococcus sp. 06-418-5]
MSCGIAIVGAGLASLRTVDALRAEGYTGDITVFGAEKYMPYTRPPISKALLHDSAVHDAVALTRRSTSARDRWLLRTRIVGSDLTKRTLTADDGSTFGYEALVAASGVEPRRLSATAGRADCRSLRSLDDAQFVQANVADGATVVVLGAGFIGCEAAASLTGRGIRVHVVALDDAPMVRPLGALVGGEIRRRHEAHGVVFHLGVGVSAVEGDDFAPVVTLSDGSSIAASLVIEAVGSRPSTSWMEGNGLDLTDGVLCSNDLRVVGTADVVAVGDVARFPNPMFDDVARRVEHWQMPMFSAKRAARSLLAGSVTTAPAFDSFAPMPWFWSDQFDVKIQSFGQPGLGTDVTVVDGELGADFCAAYIRDGVVVGVVHIGEAKKAAKFRGLIGTSMMVRS